MTLTYPLTNTTDGKLFLQLFNKPCYEKTIRIICLWKNLQSQVTEPFRIVKKGWYILKKACIHTKFWMIFNKTSNDMFIFIFLNGTCTINEPTIFLEQRCNMIQNIILNMSQLLNICFIFMVFNIRFTSDYTESRARGIYNDSIITIWIMT